MLAAATRHNAAIGHPAFQRYRHDHLPALDLPPIPSCSPIRPVPTIFYGASVAAARLKSEPLRRHVFSRYKSLTNPCCDGERLVAGYMPPHLPSPISRVASNEYSGGRDYQPGIARLPEWFGVGKRDKLSQGLAKDRFGFGWHFLCDDRLLWAPREVKFIGAKSGRRGPATIVSTINLD